LLCLTGLCSCTGNAASQASVNDHVVVIVFDQMRPDYIHRFNLENFKRLRSSSRNYPEAYVGHLGSQTVVSHLVISTGLLPKFFPWQDDTFYDRHGILGKAGAAYETGQLTRAQFWKLLEGIPNEQYLATRIRDKFHGKVFAVGGKDYAATLMGTPAADTIVTLTKALGKCTPSGVNVPAYISSNDRYNLDCTQSFGTGLSTIYGLDGARYVPGHDPGHQGGDVWTADVALEIMRRESWSALFLTFAGIDKVAHMLGEQDDHGIASVDSEYHLSDVLRIADQQLGRILDELDAQRLSGRTVIVVTADHGGQRNEYYLGNNKYQSCCKFENSAAIVNPPYWIEHLNQLGKLQAGYQDTSVKLWLADRSAANERAVVRGMQDIPGMVEAYALRRSGDGFRYEQLFSRLDSETISFQAWARKRHAELLATMASESAPDLIGLLADNYGFGRIGDHGGAQEKVQRIPMIIRVPGENPATLTQPLRLVDINSEITKTLGLKPAPRDE